MSDTAANLRREEGIALIATTLIVLVLFGLLALLLQTARHADTSSQRDANSELALSVAEAGVQDAIARIQRGEIEPGCTPAAPFSGSTSEGSYTGTVSKCPGQYRIDVTGETGCSYAEAICSSRTPDPGARAQLSGKRRVKVLLEPPASFRYALYSNTWAELKNLANLKGDIWANTYVHLEQENAVMGNVISATDWVELGNGSKVLKDPHTKQGGNVWVGGANASEMYAIKMANLALIEGWAKASCPEGCGESHTHYTIDNSGSKSKIQGDAITFGTVTTPGNVDGTITSGVHSDPPVARPLPKFVWNPSNYDSVTEFDSVALFNEYAENATLSGTFKVFDPSPSQTNRIDLFGAKVSGDFTIYTNAPIFTHGLSDTGTNQKRVVLISEYIPQAGRECAVDKIRSECAILLHNNFDPSCFTVVLAYANNGPIAVKNNNDMCGAIYAEQIQVKNDQHLRWDPRIERIMGFGPATYEVSRWEEAAP